MLTASSGLCAKEYWEEEVIFILKGTWIVSVY